MVKRIPKINEHYKDLAILVVDDDDKVRSIVTFYLKKMGFENIVDAHNGAQALNHIVNLKKPLDIILSDWEMPAPNGLTLLKAIRNNPGRTNVKFIMVTSQIERERAKISEALKWHVDGYIVKPFVGLTLFEKITLCISQIEVAQMAGENKVSIVDESSEGFEDDVNWDHNDGKTKTG
jgi:two-component system, chemotaxis family, chemotaxis protein CheY